MLEVIIPTAIVGVGAIVTFCVKVEHRLTKVETKMDLLLNHNGISTKGGKKGKK